MPRMYRPYIPQTLSDLLDLLGLMMLRAPTFADTTGYFPERNIDTVFESLNEGLQKTRTTLGEDRYLKLSETTRQMRAYFEADPEDKSKTLKGRELILEMEDLIKAAARGLA